MSGPGGKKGGLSQKEKDHLQKVANEAIGRALSESSSSESSRSSGSGGSRVSHGSYSTGGFNSQEGPQNFQTLELKLGAIQPEHNNNKNHVDNLDEVPAIYMSKKEQVKEVFEKGPDGFLTVELDKRAYYLNLGRVENSQEPHKDRHSNKEEIKRIRNAMNQARENGIKEVALEKPFYVGNIKYPQLQVETNKSLLLNSDSNLEDLSEVVEGVHFRGKEELPSIKLTYNKETYSKKTPLSELPPGGTVRVYVDPKNVNKLPTPTGTHFYIETSESEKSVDSFPSSNTSSGSRPMSPYEKDVLFPSFTPPSQPTSRGLRPTMSGPDRYDNNDNNNNNTAPSGRNVYTPPPGASSNLTSIWNTRVDKSSGSSSSSSGNSFGPKK